MIQHLKKLKVQLSILPTGIQNRDKVFTFDLFTRTKSIIQKKITCNDTSLNSRFRQNITNNDMQIKPNQNFRRIHPKKAAVGKVSAFENNINYIILTKNEIQIRYQKINLTIKHLENSIIKKWYQLNHHHITEHSLINHVLMVGNYQKTTTIGCRFTLKHIRDMIIANSQIISV